MKKLRKQITKHMEVYGFDELNINNLKKLDIENNKNINKNMESIGKCKFILNNHLDEYSKNVGLVDVIEVVDLQILVKVVMDVCEINMSGTSVPMDIMSALLYKMGYGAGIDNKNKNINSFIETMGEINELYKKVFEKLASVYSERLKNLQNKYNEYMNIAKCNRKCLSNEDPLNLFQTVEGD